jgi:hypothetical protein
MKTRIAVAVAATAFAGAMLFATSQIAFFVVQPIGALPEGRTLVIWRARTMNLIDSADAWCERQTKEVSLICRSLVLAKIQDEDVIITTLPYSETMYLWSTDGRMF